MKDYTVTISGVEHTMQLDDDDAKRYGDAAVEVKSGSTESKAAPTPSNKSRSSAKNKSA